MLTALGMADRITGLELGADDYVVKPFPEGARSRIRSVLRRWTKRALLAFPVWRHPCDKSEIDTNKRQVYKGDERIRLTGMNLVFWSCYRRSGEAFSRSEICRKCGDTHQSAT